MNKEQAIEVLEKALNIANKAGAFQLADAATVQLALNTIKQHVFVPQLVEETEKEEVKPEKKSK